MGDRRNVVNLNETETSNNSLEPQYVASQDRQFADTSAMDYLSPAFDLQFQKSTTESPSRTQSLQTQIETRIQRESRLQGQRRGPGYGNGNRNRGMNERNHRNEGNRRNHGGLDNSNHRGNGGRKRRMDQGNQCDRQIKRPKHNNHNVTGNS